MKIVIITANEKRHYNFLENILITIKNIDVELAICENNKKRQSFFQFLNQTKAQTSKKAFFR